MFYKGLKIYMYSIASEIVKNVKWFILLVIKFGENNIKIEIIVL